MAEQVKDPALSLQWLRFDPWPGNFLMPQVRPEIFFFFNLKKDPHGDVCPLRWEQSCNTYLAWDSSRGVLCHLGV